MSNAFKARARPGARDVDRQGRPLGLANGRVRRWSRAGRWEGLKRPAGAWRWIAGSRPNAVASALGHESSKTTAESYAKREAVAGAQQKRALAVLTGGQLAS